LRLIQVSEQTNKIRENFFKALFGNEEGYLCIFIRSPEGPHQEDFFKYPEHLPLVLNHINKLFHGRNVYFCPMLLTSGKSRTKSTIKSCTAVWADLDEAHPDQIKPDASIVLETSPGHYQGLWLLDKVADPIDAEDASHRLAYKYQPIGVDQTGWDLTQLLRVPLTYNMKYAKPGEVPIVMPSKVDPSVKYNLSVFQEFDPVPGHDYIDEPFPQDIGNLDPDQILADNRNKLDDRVFVLYSTEPTAASWSESLWHLEILLLEAGLPKEEVFVVVNNAKANKFARDGREPIYLWKDVCRAAAKVKQRQVEILSGNIQTIPLLTDKERASLGDHETFVDRFVNWAKSRGDAAWQYFEAGAFIALSSLLSGVVKLPTSFGIIIPNLWFMLLADTTLTRKSTAMDMAMDMLLSVDPDAVLATDGSIEGLLTSVSTRPGRPGIFWRDEFSGLLDAIRKKDYLAGMIETLTKLYDGKYQKRVLRKEVIEIRDPILIIFCGGIRSKVLELLDLEAIVSGFGPRFVYVEAESDINNYRPIGPITDEQDRQREKLVAELQDIRSRYTATDTIHIGEQTITTTRIWDAHLTPEAWDRYNKFERQMVQDGVSSSSPEIFTPMLDRLSKSALKAAVLIAASRQEPEAKIAVEEWDVLRAIGYAELWRQYNLDVASNAGKTVSERKIDMIIKAVSRRPGISRSQIMQNYHLSARETDWLFETVDQRGQIRRVKDGRGERLYPAVIR
jgi:hypothetical protein